MKMSFAAVLALALAAGCGVQAPEAANAAPVNYGIEPIEWQVTPEAAAELKVMRENDHYKPHRPTTRTFVRTQLKYGLERSDYLHKWYDRPLMGDVRLAEQNERGHMINIESWKRMAELGRICGHGFSAFTISSGREDILRRSVLPGCEAEILVETAIGAPNEKGFNNQFELAMKRIEEALAATNTFRINGRLIFTGYPQIRVNELDNYRKIKAEIARRWGDKVALMPYFSPFPLESKRVFDKKELELVKDNLRQGLRAVDGLCFSLETVINFNRRTNPRFAIEVAMPIIHSVLSEPEFKDKFFGMTVSCGHENCYRWNYAKDCTGTRRLRDNYAAVLAMKPDFINATEWDEENENTHHRPTIAQGFVTQRLLRHATATLEGRPLAPYPGDDTSIPNLAISYRKALLAGEPIEVEVLNIPDGTFSGQAFTIRFVWKNAAGEVVREYAPRRLRADQLKAAWFVTDASELLSEPLLIPELTVWFDGKMQKFSEGFWPLSLHANRSIEFRWVKQALREKTPGIKSELKLSARAADGTVEVRGFVDSPTKLRSVEVLDGPDTVYLYDPLEPHRDADGSLQVKVAWQGLPWTKIPVSGTIRLEGASKSKLVVGGIGRHTSVNDREIKFDNEVINTWPRYVWAEIAADEIDTAKFVMAVPPYFMGTQAVKELVEKDIHSWPAAAGMQLVFRRWLAAQTLLPPVDVSRAEFSFKFKPNSPDSVLRLQSVDANYHVDYGASALTYAPAGEEVGLCVFERDREKISRLSVDANRVVECRYRFNPERGGIVESGAGLGLDGILSGYVPLVCGFGSAEAGDGNVITEGAINDRAPGWPHTVPEYVREGDGTWSLKFSGADFVSMPQQVIPEYAGFELEMQVNPDEVERKQGLFTTGPAYFNLGIAKGRVFAELFLRNGYMHPKERALKVIWGPEIKPGKWSRVKVSYDREKCRIDVNGIRGESVAVSGDFFYARHSALGALITNDTFFKGRIREVRTSIGCGGGCGHKH